MNKEYSQDKIINAFKNDYEINGEKCNKHIKTAISNVFVFSDRVYKIYKNDNLFYNKNFNDISGRNKRFDFTIKDFEWNQKMSPEIYLSLRGCIIKNGQIIFVDEKEAEELIIEMKKINTKNVLLLRLMDKNLSLEDIKLIGFQLHRCLDDLPKKYVYKKLKDNMQIRMKDVYDWVLSIPQYINSQEGHIFLDVLDQKKSRYMEKINDNEIAKPNIDGHSENLFFDEGKLYIMDSYAPKEDWILADENLNFYRFATDVLVFGGQDFFNVLKTGYNNHRSDHRLDEANEDFYIYYSSMIMVPYLYMLGAHDQRRMKAAKIYHDFVRKNIGEK